MPEELRLALELLVPYRRTPTVPTYREQFDRTSLDD